MSLPFLKPKTVAGIIISHRKKDGSPEMDHMEGHENNELDIHSEALIRAMHAKDAKATSEALRAAFDLLDSEPHVEGEHLNEDEQE